MADQPGDRPLTDAQPTPEPAAAGHAPPIHPPADPPAATPAATPDLRPVADRERNTAIDILRGVALLGILPMNIVTFAAPEAAYFNPTSFFPFEGLNAAVYYINHVVFDFKMMTLFSMLFGIGVVIYAEKADRAAEAGPLHRRAFEQARLRWFLRCAWLLLFGLAHAVFLWWGDILVPYAVAGLAVLWWARRLPVAVLLTLGVLGMIVSAVALSSYGIGLYSKQGGFGGEPSPGVENMLAGMNPSPQQIDETLALYRGGYGDIFANRLYALAFTYLVLYPFMLSWRIVGAMLIGIGLYRARILDASRSARYYAIFTLANYAIGLPIVGVGIAVNIHYDYETWILFGPASIANGVGSLFVALGHAGLVFWLFKVNALGILGRALAAVGRTAFSNYILHSLILSTVYYGYGFGLYGTHDRVELAGVVLAIWALQLVISPLWLHAFRFGPLEWAWRSLTYGQRQPFRR